MLSTLQLTRKPESGRTILLCIPGTYCSPEVFERIDEAAFPSLQLIPVSWMTSPGPWDIPTLGQRIVDLLQELDAGPVLLAGHSTGGAIALAAALRGTGLLRGMLLADTGASTKGHGDIESILRAIEAGPSAEVLQLLLRRSFLHMPGDELLQRLSSYASSVPRQAAIDALSSQATLDMAANLPGIDIPVVVLHGRHDQARPIAHAELLVERLPHAELRLVDTGHTPMVEDPVAYEQALKRLCALVGL